MAGAGGSRRVLVFALGLLGLAYAASLFAPGRADEEAAWAHQVVLILVPTVAAVICFNRALSASPRARLSWVLFGVGAASWALGDLGLAALDWLDPDATQGVTIADVGFLALLPAWGAALVFYPRSQRRMLDLIGDTVDAATVVVASGAVAAGMVFVPGFGYGLDVPRTVVNLTYPIGAFALVTVVLALLARFEPRFRSTETLLALSVFSFAAGGVLFAYEEITRTFVPGSPVSLTWMAAFGGVAVAAGWGFPQPRERDFIPFSVLPLPSIFGLVAIGGLGAAAWFSQERTVLLAGAVSTGALILLRHVILLAQNRQLVRALQSAVRELESTVRAKNEFVAAASHQLRTPLTSIMLRIEELRSAGTADPLAQEYLDEVAQEVRRLDQLSTQLLALLADTRWQPSVSISVRDVVDGAVGRLLPLARQRGVHVDVEEGPPGMVVETEEGAVDEVVLNVLDNAIKYSPAGGRVAIRATRRDDRVRLSIVDHGPGVQDAPEKLFRPFTRGSHGGRGSGLGLAIVRRLCDRAGAHVTIESGGTGTVVTIDWPASTHPVSPEPVERAVSPAEGGR